MRGLDAPKKMHYYASNGNVKTHNQIQGWPMAGEDRRLAGGATFIDFQTEPSRYRHWKLAVDGDVATLTMDVDENGGLFEGYLLKLNSYDLGVDIELADVVQRLRFEHPEVKVVVMRSAKNRVFCAGANIRMLAGSTHAHKVNFCKFTNETRNGMEDSSENSGQRFITGVNGKRAVQWRLVDEIAPNSKLEARIVERAKEFAVGSKRSGSGKGVALSPLKRVIDETSLRYGFVTVDIDRAARIATISIKAPEAAPPADIDGMVAQ